MEQFKVVADQLAGHIRNPETVEAPEGIEDRRLKIYRDLFYNNIEGFVSGAFPILRQLISDDDWHEMVRDFMVNYRCHTPYFLEISQEFLNYLQTREPQEQDPPFMLELAHYEWVELALDISEEDINAAGAEAGDLLAGCPVISPLAWSLAYRFPVHHIGPDFQPESPSEQPHYLVVYRDREDAVRFMETNAVTARLLELLAEDDNVSGRDALLKLAEEMAHPEPEQLLGFGGGLLQQLFEQDIILGVAA